MSTTQETQLEFWPIDWYECRATASDVAALAAVGPIRQRPGDLFWRLPKSIGPCSPDRNHWAGYILPLSDRETAIVSVAPGAAEVCRQYVELYERSADSGDYTRLYHAAKRVVDRIREIGGTDEQGTDTSAGS